MPRRGRTRTLTRAALLATAGLLALSACGGEQAGPKLELSAALPDSRARWEAIWSRRDRIDVIAHSHPVGPEAFSREDETTMAALDSALGRVVRYGVVAPRVTLLREGAATTEMIPEPWWADLLRLASGMRVRKE
jgi:hypothetical protein